MKKVYLFETAIVMFVLSLAVSAADLGGPGVALGNGAEADAPAAVAIGEGAKVTKDKGIHAVAIGKDASAGGHPDVARGSAFETVAIGGKSVAKVNQLQKAGVVQLWVIKQEVNMSLLQLSAEVQLQSAPI
ncbi:MAG: hypothetical protein ACYTFY_19870 [Planctomycetota bacterium]|jgi:hypothetical protein